MKLIEIFMKIISGRKLILDVILITMLVTGRSLLLAQGVIPDPPHWGDGVNCPSCHVSYQDPDAQISNLKGSSNLCMSCHNLVSIANDKPFSNADRALPGISGTSHAWDVSVLNDTFGAALPTGSDLLEYVYSNHITCSTCHNPHRQTYPPFLRASNVQDALCKDCHAVRAVGLFRDSPNNKGSHPVGVNYPTSDSRFFTAPMDTALSLLDSTRVECSTCHKLHYADSGGANDGAGDGNILRAANTDSLCQSCHTYQSHIGQGCLKCHQPHDPARANIFLVKGNVPTPNHGEQPVVFLTETGENSFADGDGMYDGICEVCHTSTNHHRKDGSAPGDFSPDGSYTGHFNGQNCTACHAHSDAFRPAGANVPPPHNTFACEVCHTSPDTYVTNAPIPNAACQTCHSEGVIKTHFSNYTDPTTGQTVNLNCVECHNPMSVQKNFRGNENLYFVRNKIRNHEVVFEAQTGPYSFAYDLPDRPADMTAENYLCNTCHTQTNYHQTDGTAAISQTHNDGADCTTCHPHGDRFLALSCTQCHNSPQDNGDGIPAGGRREIVSEFSKKSHHLQSASLDIADCVVCHEMSQHTNGKVRLLDIDNSNTIYTLQKRPMKNPFAASTLIPFCANCHDGDGKKPFTDNQTPPTIDNGLWNAASHSRQGLSCMGDGESFGCHATAHGSEKLNLLSPADASQPSIPGDAKREEEGICYSCHDADGPASTNIQAQFNLSNRHNVSLLDQNDGSKVECRNCHNPHVSSSAKPLIGPDSASGSPWNGSGEAFCLTCHDGSPPARVSFPANSSGTGHDKSLFTGTKHDAELGSASCQRCHEPHGSSKISILKNNYVRADNNKYATRDYQACWDCHSENAIINQQNAFKKLHEKHVKKEDIPCIACHDVHGPHDKGEPGLINFDFALQNGFDMQLIGGKNASTAFWISGDKGYCYIRCHGKDHKPKSYKR